ncbi:MULTISPECIES: DUF4232 domain-containing protein [Streptomyces]|uniref:DUF4232 domain-containing protein n=1 Tax=Streptomyces TaxID=1883 RepID=UPI0004BDC0EF|nr:MULTISPECIES: DUF4232 domain-containing protein [Streptomyces]QHF97441.1 DUF4232 domain-containing protein [Streptomyces sp. NHF165]
MTARLNRAARCAAAVLAVIAVGAGATACNSSDSSSSKAASSASSEAKGAADEAGKEVSGVKVDKMAQKGSRTDAINSTSAAASSGSERCHTGGLDYSWGLPHGGAPDMAAHNQQTAGIKLENNSGSTCTLHGFPGVRLISESGETWDLRRSGVEPTTVTLKPGEAASVPLDLLPVKRDLKDTKPFLVDKVMLTPPDETSHVTLDWPYGGAILDQSGATRPGTFVNPVAQG